MRRRRFDSASFAAGLALAALGVLVELEVINLEFEFAVPALLATMGTALLALGLAKRR